LSSASDDVFIFTLVKVVVVCVGSNNRERINGGITTTREVLIEEEKESEALKRKWVKCRSLQLLWLNKVLVERT